MDVRLLSKPNFDVDAFIQWLTDELQNDLADTRNREWKRTPDATPAEELVEVAGRMCYMSFGDRQSPKSNSQYITNLIQKGHESVLEHPSWTILISGVSRSFTHQLVRHRPGFAYSQLSQQYFEETEASFLPPEEVKRHPEIYQKWLNTVESCRKMYNDILTNVIQEGDNWKENKEKLRAARSAARSILPNATETKIVVSANARAWRHFLRMRGAILGDREMREVSVRVFKILSSEAPALFADFESTTLEDGNFAVLQKENS